MGLLVEKPGLLTTVQDGGRWGYQRYGVPVSGAMDVASYRLANQLVGNRDGAAALEITVSGPVLRFEGQTTCAVAGAEFDLRLDGRGCPMNRCWTALDGERLVFGSRRLGTRAYLAVRGGIDVPVVLGSRSTHVASGMGGVEGRALRTGDRLPTGRGDELEETPDGAARGGPAVSLPRGGARVRVIEGPDHDRFEPASRDEFWSTRYVVTPESDRMGYRLQGRPVKARGHRSLISTAVPLGSVQVPPSGLPIILMADRQTCGGYPRIGTVITTDMSIVAQLSSGNWIEFERCGQDVALREQIARERRFLL